ncbi:lipoprotein, LprL [Mycobacterium haemophilum DSM 44634]
MDLEHRLQTAYQQALARPGADQAGLTAAQDSWRTVRDGCAQNADVRTCVVEAYQTRLVQLAIADPATVTPAVITYHCPLGSGPLTAQFYNQFDPATAVLNWNGDQEILFVQPSGSGARYGRQGVEYWEHQGEVRLDFNGNKFVCTTR